MDEFKHPSFQFRRKKTQLGVTKKTFIKNNKHLNLQEWAPCTQRTDPVSEIDWCVTEKKEQLRDSSASSWRGRTGRIVPCPWSISIILRGFPRRPASYLEERSAGPEVTVAPLLNGYQADSQWRQKKPVKSVEHFCKNSDIVYCKTENKQADNAFYFIWCE